MQDMHGAARNGVRKLLTAQQVQGMLHIDRSTVYRMAEDGRLPAIKVGRQWRFPADRITALLGQEPAATSSHPAAGHGLPAARPIALAPAVRDLAVVPGPDRSAAATPGPGDLDPVFVQAAEAVLAVAADLLGVMMVVTDMDGRSLTPVANPCDWFADRATDPEVVSACSAEWQSMADDPDFRPVFRTGVLGFQCARAFIRSGTSLVGMVLAGGIAPEGSGAPGLYHLQDTDRDRVLAALPRVAAALSRVPARGVPFPAGPVPHRPEEPEPVGHAPTELAPTELAPTEQGSSS